VLESATRDLRGMEAVLDRVPEQQVSALLASCKLLPSMRSPKCRWSRYPGTEEHRHGSHPSAV
jgi:hypothetical protein